MELVLYPEPSTPPKQISESLQVPGSTAIHGTPDPIHGGEEFALVRSTLDAAEEVTESQEQIRIRAGDEVIITAYDLYDGKVIGS